ncbi:hypothetical protein MHY01S_30250 [Meiothermus hypogaeus NBRC 106114]|uniref:Uncharacterized protein n=1 Tax=Meiothermus hypogaeus NBRC 106114 TaxID=1227553 RepID=A0A511R5H1_9DEIN|nr:hypothetical protein MHY01S_30250 [Meiothermus hypogaeus NBRC 106114]
MNCILIQKVDTQQIPVSRHVHNAFLAHTGDPRELYLTFNQDEQALAGVPLTVQQLAWLNDPRWANLPQPLPLVFAQTL